MHTSTPQSYWAICCFYAPKYLLTPSVVLKLASQPVGDVGLPTAYFVSVWLYSYASTANNMAGFVHTAPYPRHTPKLRCKHTSNLCFGIRSHILFRKVSAKFFYNLFLSTDQLHFAFTYHVIRSSKAFDQNLRMGREKLHQARNPSC